MSASALPPTAPTTLVILLGASIWPNSPGFQASEAFVHAAQGFKDYIRDPQGFGLPATNLFDQFNAPSGSSDQLEMLGSFLEERIQTLKAANQGVRDVLIYFVGHGGFAGPSADFYLMPRRANANSLRASGIAIDALAEVLREKARLTRRYLFLDCCFAAAAFRSFQGGPDQTAIAKTLDAFSVQNRSRGFPQKGTVLLCSSDHKSPSMLLPDESCTMFSRVLLDVLTNGDLHRSLKLSLRDIKELVEDRLAALPEKNAPRPGLHSPDQSEGDAADVPLFPNPHTEKDNASDRDTLEPSQDEALRRSPSLGELQVSTLIEQGKDIGISNQYTFPYKQIVSEKMMNILDRNELRWPILGGKYRVVRVITEREVTPSRQGNMTLYQVEQEGTPSHIYMMKELQGFEKTSLDILGKDAERFNRECEFLKGLKHPSIPVCVSSFQENKNYYLIMNFIPGCTLQEIIKKIGGPLDEAQGILWMMQMCDALAYLHSRSSPIVLTDIQPDDILSTPGGNAILLNTSMHGWFRPSRPRNLKQYLDSMSFSSPEAGHIKLRPDARSEIYSLGANLYYLLTNQDPEVMKTPQSGEILALNSRLHNQTEQVIIKAMQQDPDMRFQRADAMKNALNHCLGMVQSKLKSM